MTLAVTLIPPSLVVTVGRLAVPALVTARLWIEPVSLPREMLPDVVVVKLMALLAPLALRLVTVRFAATLLSVMAPSVVVAAVTVSAPPPLWAKVMGALAPTVARLLNVSAEAPLLAILMAAAPAPLVVALPEVTLEVTSCVALPMPVTAVAIRLAALISVPAPLP